MACPNCGCKETYQYDDEDAPDDSWERCAACGVVFHIEDHTDEDDECEHPAADALRWAGFGPEDNRAMGEGLQVPPLERILPR